MTFLGGLILFQAGYSQNVSGPSDPCPYAYVEYSLIFSACPDTDYKYFWNIDGGSIVSSNPISPFVIVEWDETPDGNGAIEVTYTNLPGGGASCSSTQLGGTVTKNVVIKEDLGIIPPTIINGDGMSTNDCPTEITIVQEIPGSGFQCNNCNILVKAGSLSFESLGSFAGSTVISLDELPSGPDGNKFGVLYSFRFEEGDPVCSEFNRFSDISTHTFYPPPPQINTPDVTNPICIGDEGSVTITHPSIQGGEHFVYTITQYTPFQEGDTDCGNGQPPEEFNGNLYCEGYISNWINNNGALEVNLNSSGFNSDEGDPFNLRAGYYILQIESERTKDNPDLPKCIVDENFIIEDPEPLSALVYDRNDPSCKNGSNGYVEITVSGVRSSYNESKDIHYELFDLENTPQLIQEEEVELTSGKFRIEQLSAGNYSVSVYDFCSDPASVSFEIVDSSTPMQISVTSKPAICGNDGEVNVIVENVDEINGTDFNYKYTLTNIDNPLDTYSQNNNGLFSDLKQGAIYEAKVEANNCITENPEGDVAEIDLPDELNFDITPINPNCSDEKGAFEFEVTNPRDEMDYTIEINGPTEIPTIRTSESSHVFNDLEDGEYTFTIIDHCLYDLEYSAIKEAIVVPKQVAITNIETSPIECADGSNGTTSFSVTNGTPPYAPELNGFVVEDDGGGNYHIDGLSKGIYTLSVFDECGKVDTEEFTVAVMNNATEILLDDFSVFKGISCFGFDDGEIVLDISGGHQISGGDKGYMVKLIGEDDNEISNYADEGDRDFFSFQNLEPGTYYPIIEDGNECIKVFSSTTLSIPEPSPLFISGVDPSHFPPNQIQYDQDNNLYFQCRGNLVSFSPNYGGGTVGYSYIMEGGTISDQITNEGPYENIGPGNYNFTVTDDNGCSESISFTLHDPEELTLSLLDEVFPHGFNVECHGDDTGEVEALVSGGVPPYKYIIDPPEVLPVILGSDSYTFSELPVGTSSVNYYVTVIDYLGCEIQKTITLEPPPPLSFISEVISETVGEFEIPCKGESASILFTGTGGDHTNPYTLLIDDEVAGLFDQSDKTLEIDLDAGSYTMKIQDNLGCQSMESVLDLDEPDEELTISNVEVFHPNCIGGSDGSFSVTASGGIPPYEFKIEEEAWQSSGTFSNLEATNYQLTIRDFNQCEISQLVSIPSNPNPLTLELVGKVPPSCHHGTDGSITVRTTNFNLKSGDQLLYRITGGHYGNEIIEVNANVISGASEHTYTFENLWDTKDPDFVASHYQIWVEDLHECEDLINQYAGGSALALNAPDLLELTAEIVPPSCYGGENGYFTASATGGTGDYLFSLKGTNFFPSNTSEPTSYVIEDIEAGEYTIYLRDSNFQPEQPCQTIIDVHVPSGLDIEFDAMIQHVSCAGGIDGSITVDLDTYYEDETPYSYEPDQLNLVWLFDEGTIGEGNEITNLNKGNYSLFAQYNQDTIVCEEQMDFPVLGPNAPLTISIIKTYKSPCGDLLNGSAIIEFQGGWADSTVYYNLDDSGWLPILGSSLGLNQLEVGDHEIQLAQAGFQCITSQSFQIKKESIKVETLIVDPPSCSSGGTDGQVILSAENILDPVFHIVDSSYSSSTGHYSGLKVSQEYKFVVKDAADLACSSDTLTFLFQECFDDTDDLKIIDTPIVKQSTCEISEDGKAEIIVSGGLPPYRYFSDDVEVGSSLTDLSKGTHQIVALDALGKSDTTNIQIESLPTIELSSLVTTNAKCPGSCDGAITNLTFIGGSGFYHVEWEDGTAGSTRSGLCPGEYSYTVSDERNDICTLTGSVLIEQFAELSISLEEAASPTCHDGEDGEIEVSATGGSNSYLFEWENSHSSAHLSQVKAGDYAVTIKDQLLGCTVTETFTIPERPQITITDTIITPPSCGGRADGNIRLMVGNALTPLVTWENGQTGFVARDLEAGYHGFIISTSSGCEISGEIELHEKIPLTVEVDKINNSCSGICSGTIDLTISGGLGPYYVEWESGIKSASRGSLCNGTYTYSVQDRLGCVVTGSINISSPEPLAVQVVSQENVKCLGESNGNISIEVIGGTSPYTYQWSNGQAGETIADLPKGTYSVTVTDVNGCATERSFTITEPDALFTFGDELIHPSCFGYDDGQIITFPMGGTAPYTYEWNNKAISPSNEQLSAGNYVIRITDANGCEFTKNYELSSPSALDLANIEMTDPICYDEATGTISLIAVGGTPSYNYRWSSGQETGALDELKAGEYEVIVTDEQGCELIRQFELINPKVPVIHGLDHHIMMCEGGTVMLSPKGEWKTYHWEGPDGEKSQEAFLEVNDGGDYLLTVTDALDCPATQDIYVEVSDNILTADFIRISEAIVNEPLVFVDLSLPLPESMAWVIPDDPSILINEMDVGSMELVFTETGEYEIGLRALFQNCFSEIFKTILIEEGEAINSNNGRLADAEPKTEVSIYPNPASQQVNLIVGTPSRNKLTIQLMDVSKEVVIKETLRGRLDYLVQWDVSEMMSGIYILMIGSGDDFQKKRVLIVK